MSPSDMGRIRNNWSGEWWLKRHHGTTDDEGKGHVYSRAEFDELGDGVKMGNTFRELTGSGQTTYMVTMGAVSCGDDISPTKRRDRRLLLLL